MNEKVCPSQNENSQTKTDELDYEGVLNKLGVGCAQWMVFIVCGLMLLMGMSEATGIGIIAITSKCDFKLSSVDKGFLTGTGLIGNIISSYFWGYISDTVGRRPVLITTTLVTNVISLISMFIPNFWVFVAFRFFAGLSASGAINITYVYLGEFFTAYYRPIVINYVGLFVAFSVVFVPGVAWLVLLMDWSLEITSDFFFRPWRLLLILYVLPGLLAGFALFYLPESPKILFSLGKPEKAYESLNWICKRNHKGRTYDEVVGCKVKILAAIDYKGNKIIAGKKISCANLLSKMWNEAYPLFQRPLVRNFAICSIIMCSIYTSYLGMGFWYPEIQNSLRSYASTDNKMKTCDVMQISLHKAHANSTVQLECIDRIEHQTYIDCFIYGGICLTGYALLGLVVNLFGRKMILTGFLGIAGILFLALLWIFEPYGIVISFSLFLVLTQLCMSIMTGIIVDLIPTLLCGRAVCICMMFGRLSSVVATNFVGAMMEHNCRIIFASVSGFSICCAVLVLLLPI